MGHNEASISMGNDPQMVHGASKARGVRSFDTPFGSRCLYIHPTTCIIPPSSTSRRVHGHVYLYGCVRSGFFFSRICTLIYLFTYLYTYLLIRLLNDSSYRSSRLAPRASTAIGPQPGKRCYFWPPGEQGSASALERSGPRAVRSSPACFFLIQIFNMYAYG